MARNPIPVGDIYFKEKSYDKMLELINSGKTILMATHFEKEVKKVCERALLMQNGEIIMDGHRMRF